METKHGWADKGGDRKSHLYRDKFRSWGKVRISECGLETYPAEDFVQNPYPVPGDGYRCRLCLRVLHSVIPKEG